MNIPVDPPPPPPPPSFASPPLPSLLPPLARPPFLPFFFIFRVCRTAGKDSEAWQEGGRGGAAGRHRASVSKPAQVCHGCWRPRHISRRERAFSFFFWCWPFFAPLLQQLQPFPLLFLEHGLYIFCRPYSSSREDCPILFHEQLVPVRLRCGWLCARRRLFPPSPTSSAL